MTGQPTSRDSVHSGRGGKSIAHAGCEAKATVIGAGQLRAREQRALLFPLPEERGLTWRLYRLIHSRFVIPEQPDRLRIEER